MSWAYSAYSYYITETVNYNVYLTVIQFNSVTFIVLCLVVCHSFLFFGKLEVDAALEVWMTNEVMGALCVCAIQFRIAVI